MTTEEKLLALKAPFAPEDIEWRVQTAGKTTTNKMYAFLIPYIDNRAVQDRLDSVIGAAGWQSAFRHNHTGSGVVCTLSLRLDGEWVSKEDGADETQIEAVKGGISSAMKRAAVQWGIGRYLYDLEAAIVNPQEDKPQDMDGWIVTQVKIEGRKKRIYFKRPLLPKWALPKGEVRG